MKYVCGIDVGGTSIKFGLFDLDGLLLEKWEIVTRTQEEGKHIIPDIASSLEDKINRKNLNKSEIIGIGVDVPGPVVEDTTITEGVNLGWGRVNVSKELEDLLEIHVVVANDANVAALGEMWQGGGAGYDSICMVTLGTGVGGGIVIDGKIVTGKHGAAGEIGHITVNPEEKILCNCGKSGCLEQYAAAPGITRLGNKLLQESDEPSSLRDYGDLNSKVIFDSAKEGDKLAVSLVEEFGRYMGLALSFIAQTIDPHVFVIGGGVSKAGDIILDVTKEHFQKFVMQSINKTEFRLATLGNDAGIYGCAKMVLK